MPRLLVADAVLRMLSEAMRREKPAGAGSRGPVGPCGPPGPSDDPLACDGTCHFHLATLPDYETAVSFDCRTIKKFRELYAEATQGE